MSVVTQFKMENAVIDSVISSYIKKNQMFTVYQIWRDSCSWLGPCLHYDIVRKYVENQINDTYSKYNGWTRSVGNHLTNLDSKVGNVGAAPQIYHPIGANIKKYDQHFRLFPNNVPAKKEVATVQPTVTVEKTLKVITSNKISGLFRFNVWMNGKLVPCNLRQVRGSGGKFMKNRDYEGYGLLDDGSPVVVKQDNDGKLYAISREN